MFRLKINQYFCKHDYTLVAKHRSVSENLWKCEKCHVYYIQHWRLGLGYKSRTPHIEGWIFKKYKGETKC